VIQVLVAAPRELFTELFVQVLERQDDIAVLREVDDLEDLTHAANGADVVFISSEFDQTDVLQAISNIHAAYPAAHIVMLRVPDIPEEILPYLEAGAHGYLRSGDELDQLQLVVRTVVQQGAYVDSSLAPLLFRRLSEMSRALAEPMGRFDREAELSPRELEVVAKIAEGYTNQEIADELGLGVGTVKNHIHNILRKLQARDREDAARWYAWKLTSPDGTETAALDETEPAAAESHALPWTDQERALLTETLSLFCASLEWPLGHLLVLAGDDELAPSGIWHTPPERFVHFRTVTESMRYVAGSGVIARQLERPRPVWITDVRRDTGYRRREAAAQDGLRSGLLLPIEHEGRTVGVLEFYTTRQAQPDPTTVAEILHDREHLAELISPSDPAGADSSGDRGSLIQSAS
jgi:DNA-binding NarL/FixJ family response regulator